MSLPKDPAARKAIPVYSGFVKYFPDAMAAVAQLSLIANEQHNPGQPLHWAKGKSTDHQDAFMRHMMDELETEGDEDGVLHATKQAWRAMAHLQSLADKGVDIFARPRPLVIEPSAPANVHPENCGDRECDLCNRQNWLR